MRATLPLETSRLPAGMNPADLSIAQMLQLASRANISFDVVDGRLIVRAVRADWRLWAPIRHYLDEIGVEAIVDYFRRTKPEERMLLSATA